MVRDNLFGERLRKMREAAGLSQKKLGILAGLDPFVASARINRYERGVHIPTDISLVETLATLLDIPAYMVRPARQGGMSVGHEGWVASIYPAC